MSISLPNNEGVIVQTYGNAEFSRDAMRLFEGLRDELADNADLLHPQMGTLAGAVRRSVESGDIGLSLRICEFLGAVLANPKAISEIENAVAISFVEAHELRATDVGRMLLERMPDRVRSVLLEQERRGGAQ